MGKKHKAGDGRGALDPMTAIERKKLDERIKKKYDRFRRRDPELHKTEAQPIRSCAPRSRSGKPG